MGFSSMNIDDSSSSSHIIPCIFWSQKVQSLASPAYLHFLATSTTTDGQSLLLDPKFKEFLKYLYRTWREPEYSIYITYPHGLYFLELLINNESFCRELAQVSFRNFCHQQQFYTWQHRFVTLYGGGEEKKEEEQAPATETTDGLVGEAEGS
jgi:hypothetical protein